MTSTRNTVAELLTKIDSLEAGGGVRRSEEGETNNAEVTALVNTLKTNVIGLGNYINSINREVNTLATRTKDSIENLNQQVVVTGGYEDQDGWMDSRDEGLCGTV